MQKTTILSLCLMAVILISIETGQAQPDPQWVHTYGDGSYEYCYWAAPVNDGGYVFVGYRDVPSNGSDVLVIRADAEGETMWQRTYGGTMDDCGRQIEQTTDGNFIVTAWTDSYGPGIRSAYLLKLDQNGDTLWTRTYGGTQYNNAWGGIQTSDGGYALAGYTDCSGCERDKIYLVKTDAAGDTMWTRYYGGDGSDYATRVCQTSDGGYIVSGYTTSFGAGEIDGMLVKADSLGNEEWMQAYGGTTYERIRDVIQTSDGGYIFAGESTSFSVGSYDYWIVRLDEVGDTLWTRTFGGYSDDRAKCVWQTDDGGFVVSGGTYSFGPGDVDVYVKKLDDMGNCDWTFTYGGVNYDTGYFVRQLNDGRYMIAGTTESFGYGQRDFWMIQLGGMEPSLELTLTPTDPPIQIPETGGTFDFNIEALNTYSYSQAFDFWSELTLPDGSTYGPLLGPVDLDFNPAANINRNKSQVIPANAPAGTYTYNACIGEYPDSVWIFDEFTFEKLGTAGDGGSFNWWENREISDANPTASGFELLGAYPNPFNPTTAISFQLSAFSQVNLSVYDVSGRKVVTLVDGYRDAGAYEVAFDGSALASGVYLYRLEADGQLAVGKMVLMK